MQFLKAYVQEVNIIFELVFCYYTCYFGKLLIHHLQIHELYWYPKLLVFLSLLGNLYLGNYCK